MIPIESRPQLKRIPKADFVLVKRSRSKSRLHKPDCYTLHMLQHMMENDMGKEKAKNFQDSFAIPKNRYHVKSNDTENLKKYNKKCSKC